VSTGIVILNYNGSDETIRCIQSIESHNSADIKYFIIDNGSTEDRETAVIEAFLKSAFGDQCIRTEGLFPADFNKAKALFIASSSNDGYARGNNKGLRAAFSDPDIDDILVLNNDVFFDSDIIPKLISQRAKLDRPGILTPVIYNTNGGIEYSCARRFPSNWEIMLPFVFFKKDLFHLLSKSSDSQKILITNPELLRESAFPIGMPSGACMFIRKSILQEIDGLDEGTFLYYEENILCKKLLNKGLTNYCIPSVNALHIGGASTSKTTNLFLQKCNLESADYYLKSFSNSRLPLRIIWWIVKQAWELKFWIKNAR